MGRRIDCPLPGLEDAFVVLPDEWLGLHAQRRDQAVREAAAYDSNTLTLFAISLAIADDWGGLPGLNGKPENWDFAQVKIPVIAWVNETVLVDFNKAFIVPKNSLSPSPDGSMAKQETTKAPGNLKKTE